MHKFEVPLYICLQCNKRVSGKVRVYHVNIWLHILILTHRPNEELPKNNSALFLDAIEVSSR